MDKKTAHKIATASARMAAKVAYRATITKLAQPAGAGRIAPEGPTAGAMMAVQSDPGQLLGRLQQVQPTGGQGKAVEFFQKLQSGQLPEGMALAQLANAAYYELQNNYSEAAGARLGLTPSQVQSGQALISQQSSGGGAPTHPGGAPIASASDKLFTRQSPAFHRTASLQKTASKLEAKTKTSKLMAIARKFERELSGK
jgi:hypothetical protein